MLQSITNKRMAMIFPGISANYKQELSALSFEQRNEVKSLGELINKKYSFDLWAYLSDSDYYADDNPMIDWMAIYALNCSIFKSYIAGGCVPMMSMGYSLGLITAAACNGAISFEEGLHLLEQIGDYTKKSKYKENMAIIIGKTEQEVAALIQAAGLSDSVQVSIINNDDCITVSGLNDSIDQVVQAIRDQGALKAVKLNSSIAFHSKYARENIGDFEKAVHSLNVQNMKTPIISAYTQQAIYEADDLKQDLIRNMYTCMDWRQALFRVANKVEVFGDTSLDGSLTKLSRIVLVEHEFITLNKLNRLVVQP